MKRMHIHENLSESIRLYRAMFGNAGPTVLKSDYCKWELTNPAVNFAISRRGAMPGVDHLGIQVESATACAGSQCDSTRNACHRRAARRGIK